MTRFHALEIEAPFVILLIHFNKCLTHAIRAQFFLVAFVVEGAWVCAGSLGGVVSLFKLPHPELVTTGIRVVRSHQT